MFKDLLSIAGIIIGILVLIFIEAFIGVWLWNWLMPFLFGLPEVSFWQFWGLCILTHIIFPSYIHNSNK